MVGQTDTRTEAEAIVVEVAVVAVLEAVVVVDDGRLVVDGGPAFPDNPPPWVQPANTTAANPAPTATSCGSPGHRRAPTFEG